jgi:predicted SPOUT superfamily RNA methylase MTH1
MPEIWVALPDSSLSDEQTKRDKSIKIAQFARTCAIFRVKRIYIYHDMLSQFEREDPDLLRTILRFLDTPQYLRKILYPKMPQLEYAGILHPIKAPHHKPPEDIKKVKPGAIRTAVTVKVKGQLFVETGLGGLIPFSGQGFEGRKVNVKFTAAYPNLRAVEASPDDIHEYWGYEVKDVASITKLIASLENAEVILTSRKGAHFKKMETKLIERSKSVQNLLIVFGSPKHGVHELIAKEGGSMKPYDFVINMFPNQATETVRLEEALLGSLAILNSSLPNSEKQASSNNLLKGISE